jgi:homocitrate synthase NifV
MVTANNPRDVWIIDTTLRDGEQAAGVVFNESEHRIIAGLLDDAGVPELEIGTPAMGEQSRSTIRSIVDMKLKTRLTCWCRALRKDIDWARMCGTPAVHISLPASKILMDVFYTDETEVIKSIHDIVRYASQFFEYVSIGVQDVARADREFIKFCAYAAHRAGAFRLRLADTVGLMNPIQVTELLNQVRTVCEMEFEFHAHNDLGMATANSVAAISAGAKSVSTTVNGIGERAGNAALEEVVLAVEQTLSKQCGIQTRSFQSLSAFVAQCAHEKIPSRKPVVGSGLFRHESGIHVRGLCVDRQSYEPFSAESVGQQTEKFVIGKHSGLSSILSYFQQDDIPIDQRQGYEILGRVKSFCDVHKRNVVDEELRRFYLDTLTVVLACS